MNLQPSQKKQNKQTYVLEYKTAPRCVQDLEWKKEKKTF